MIKIETATCQDCGWQGPVEETNELRDLRDRVLPGEVMPAGECPVEGCGAAAMLDEAHSEADDCRTALKALMGRLDRLQYKIYADSLRAPIGVYVKGMADTARRALARGQRLQPLCDTCGGTDVRVDAWACWDVDTQSWELHSTYEAAAYCADCEADCSCTMRPVAEAP